MEFWIEFKSSTIRVQSEYDSSTIRERFEYESSLDWIGIITVIYNPVDIYSSLQKMHFGLANKIPKNQYKFTTNNLLAARVWRREF